MIRKYISVFCIVLCLILPLIVSAKKNVLYDELKPYGEFYVLGEDNEKVAKALGVNVDELDDVEDSFLAVNKENTKQIRLSVNVTDFSDSIGNLSNLSNDNIIALTSSLSGFADAKGEVIEKENQKFLKIQLRTADNGGEYILTQYITVAAKQSFILSFYTDINEDTDYIEKTFETFSSPHFNTTEAEGQDNYIQYIILIAAGLFFVICIAVVISIVVDIVKGKRQEDETV